MNQQIHKKTNKYKLEGRRNLAETLNTMLRIIYNRKQERLHQFNKRVSDHLDTIIENLNKEQ